MWKIEVGGSRRQKKTIAGKGEMRKGMASGVANSLGALSAGCWALQAKLSLQLKKKIYAHVHIYETDANTAQ